MKRGLVLLVLTVACLAVAGTVAAQDTQGTVRFSWDGCDPQVVNKNWAAPGVYAMVISGDNFTAGDDADNNVGAEFKFDVRPVTGLLPDAWRFDDTGCQTGTYLTLSTNGFSKTCAAFKGANPFPITFYGTDTANPTFAQCILSNTYDKFTPLAATRYTFWVVSFDHTYSTVNPTNPGVDCGEVDAQLCIGPWWAVLLTQRGVSAKLQTKVGDSPYVTFNGPSTCDGVPAVPATWGKVKSLYR